MSTTTAKKRQPSPLRAVTRSRAEKGRPKTDGIRKQAQSVSRAGLDAPQWIHFARGNRWPVNCWPGLPRDCARFCAGHEDVPRAKPAPLLKDRAKGAYRRGPDKPTGICSETSWGYSVSGFQCSENTHQNASKVWANTRIIVPRPAETPV